MGSQPWIWRGAVRCLSLNSRWVNYLNIKGLLFWFFSSEKSLTLLPHFLSQIIFHHVGSLWGWWGENIWSAQQPKCQNWICNSYTLFCAWGKWGCMPSDIAYHHQYFLCETQFLNQHTVPTRNKFVPYISSRMLHCWKRAQYAPLFDKRTRVTVCSQSVYEWEPSSPSCACTGPPCTSL